MTLDTRIHPRNPHEALLVDIFTRASEIVGATPTFVEILRVYDQVLKETGIQDNGDLYKILLQCSLRNEGSWIERLTHVLVCLTSFLTSPYLHAYVCCCICLLCRMLLQLFKTIGHSRTFMEGKTLLSEHLESLERFAPIPLLLLYRDLLLPY